MAALTHPGCRGPFQHPMDAAVLPPAILAPPPASWAHHQLSSTTLDAFQGPKPVPGRALRRNSVFGSIAMVRSASTPTPPSSTSPTVPESPPRRQGSLHHLRRHSGISLLLAAHSSTTRSPDSRAGSWHANGAQQSLNPMPSSHHIDQVPKRISFSGPQSWKSKAQKSAGLQATTSTENSVPRASNTATEHSRLATFSFGRSTTATNPSNMPTCSEQLSTNEAMRERMPPSHHCSDAPEHFRSLPPPVHCTAPAVVPHPPSSTRSRRRRTNQSVRLSISANAPVDTATALRSIEAALGAPGHTSNFPDCDTERNNEQQCTQHSSQLPLVPASGEPINIPPSCRGQMQSNSCRSEQLSCSSLHCSSRTGCADDDMLTHERDDHYKTGSTKKKCVRFHWPVEVIGVSAAAHDVDWLSKYGPHSTSDADEVLPSQKTPSQETGEFFTPHGPSDPEPEQYTDAYEDLVHELKDSFVLSAGARETVSRLTEKVTGRSERNSQPRSSRMKSIHVRSHSNPWSGVSQVPEEPDQQQLDAEMYGCHSPKYPTIDLDLLQDLESELHEEVEPCWPPSRPSCTVSASDDDNMNTESRQEEMCQSDLDQLDLPALSPALSLSWSDSTCSHGTPRQSPAFPPDHGFESPGETAASNAYDPPLKEDPFVGKVRASHRFTDTLTVPTRESMAFGSPYDAPASGQILGPDALSSPTPKKETPRLAAPQSSQFGLGLLGVPKLGSVGRFA